MSADPSAATTRWRRPRSSVSGQPAAAGSRATHRHWRRPWTSPRCSRQITAKPRTCSAGSSRPTARRGAPWSRSSPSALRLHMKVEETSCTQRSRSRSTAARLEIDVAKTEHAEARKALDDVGAARPAAARVLAARAPATLEAGIALRVSEEEDEVFPNSVGQSTPQSSTSSETRSLPRRHRIVSREGERSIRRRRGRSMVDCDVERRAFGGPECPRSQDQRRLLGLILVPSGVQLNCE